MTAIASILDNQPKSAAADPSRSASLDLFPVLLGSAEQSITADSARAASGIGRLGASSESKKPRNASERAAALMDPTNVAVTELASRGTPKASVEAAVREGASPSNQPGNFAGAK